MNFLYPPVHITGASVPSNCLVAVPVMEIGDVHVVVLDAVVHVLVGVQGNGGDGGRHGMWMIVVEVVVSVGVDVRRGLVPMRVAVPGAQHERDGAGEDEHGDHLERGQPLAEGDDREEQPEERPGRARRDRCRPEAATPRRTRRWPS
jgi:hypothetical protein